MEEEEEEEAGEGWEESQVFIHWEEVEPGVEREEGVGESRLVIRKITITIDTIHWN